MAASIAITGVGQVSALGAGMAALRAGIAAGRCGIGPLTLFAHQGRSAVAAQVEAPVATSDENAWLSRSDRLALAASDEACRAAGLDVDALGDAGLAVGTTTGGMREAEEAYRRWRGREDDRALRSGFAGMPLSTVGAAVAQRLGVLGPRVTVSTACSSGALAITAAADMIRRGDASVALAVGADALCRLTYAGFDALQALDPEPCRPFDAARRGLSLGEGAAAFVLEDADRARARGAAIHAILLGAGTSADAHHVTAPHPDSTGAIAAMRGALEAARIPPDAIDYVNAHGSGTKHNDDAEVAALRAVLGDRLARVPVSSSKSQLGHCLAAAGALEAAITVAALANGILPGTVTLRTADAAWSELDFVPTPGRRAALGIALSSSYGFGGHNVTLVLARPEVRP